MDVFSSDTVQSLAASSWFRTKSSIEHSSMGDAAVLGDGRLREVYYAVLKGEAGDSARRAFGVGNEIARTIEHLSSHLDEVVTIDDMAAQVGMSRAVFHRKFKQATTMSPIQFVKAMRLNNAAMKIAGGTTVNEAAMEVGYVSSSQFSREFKRLYGQSPRQWSNSLQLPAGITRRTAQSLDQLPVDALRSTISEQKRAFRRSSENGTSSGGGRRGLDPLPSYDGT